MWIWIRKTELKLLLNTVSYSVHQSNWTPLAHISKIFRTGRKYLSRLGRYNLETKHHLRCGVQNIGTGTGFLRLNFPVGTYFWIMRLLLSTIFKQYESRSTDFTWQNTDDILAIKSVAVRHRFDIDLDQTFHFDAQCRSRSHPTPSFSQLENKNLFSFIQGSAYLIFLVSVTDIIIFNILDSF